MSGSHLQGNNPDSNTGFSSKLTLGTRPSQLARRQTDLVAAALRSAWPQLQIDIKIYTTRGDRELNRPLPEIGGKGLFTAEIEEALRRQEIDLAVHSLKDLPTADSDGLIIGAVPERADARDILISRHQQTLEDLPHAPLIGTSSPRRAAQALFLRPDARIVSIRGNLDTRIRKAASQDYDAVILAAAGMARMGWKEQITGFLSFDAMLPAPAQGALAIQCRTNDSAVDTLLKPIHHPLSSAATTAERSFLRALGGGCCTPVAAYAEPFHPGYANQPWLWLRSLVASLDGRRLVRVETKGSAHQAEQLGQDLAREALEKGAAEILGACS